MKNTQKFSICLLFLCFIYSNLFAQVSMTANQLLLDFSGYEGAGFANPPGPGQLSSADWILSEATNLNRGMTTGGETGAGFYAYIQQGDAVFWVQPTGAYMTPGNFTLLIQNNTPGPITELSISYDILTLNDQNRANSLNFSFSEDNVNFIGQAPLNFTTTAPAAPVPQILKYPKGLFLSGLNIPQGNVFALRWETDDVSGAGNRDEIGLDNILLQTGPEVLATELRFMNLPNRFVTGQSYALQVCATDASGNVSISNTDPIILTELSGTGANLLSGIQGAGCRTFFLTPTAAGPVNLRTDNGILTPRLSGNIPVYPGSVFISEYIEGSGSNRCIEIYNGTGAQIDLAAEGYEVLIYNNGSLTATPSDIYPLFGNLAPGDVFVICNENAGPDFLAQADQTAPEGDFVFSGDDVIELRNDQGSQDVIGKLGEDPGSAWTGGGCSTENSTLIRHAGIRFGDKNSADTFDPSIQWTCQPKNTWAYLGYHNTNLSATQLIYRRLEADSVNCMAEGEYFAVEVCAFDAQHGYHAPNFPGSISLTTNGNGPWEIAGLNGGNSLQVDENGCATFYFRNFASETFAFIASANGLNGTISPNISILPGCQEARVLQAVINPCGNETQNEFLSLLNGNTPLDLADFTLASIDHLSGSPQPNYNYTFNSSGTRTPDNPKPCNTTDNVCLEWLNVNDATHRQMLINLRDELNALSPCNIFEIPDQTGASWGEIPAGGRMIVFLGAGGNGTLGTEGFDNAAINLDFSSYCASGLQPVYLVASTRKTGFGGYFHNQDARTIRVLINGNILDVQGTDPFDSREAEVINAFGAYLPNQNCVPPSAFPVTPLPLSQLNFRAEIVDKQRVRLFWETTEEKDIQFFAIERRHESESVFQRLALLPAKNSFQKLHSYSFLDEKAFNGKNVYRIGITDYGGNITFSSRREVFVQPSQSIFSIYPQAAEDFVHLIWDATEYSPVQVQILNVAGQICLERKFPVQPGQNERKISLRNLSKGYYLIQIRQRGKAITVAKLILQ